MYEELVQTHCKVHQGTCMKAQLQAENKSVTTTTSGHVQTKHTTTDNRNIVVK